jgi:hypothetical protein
VNNASSSQQTMRHVILKINPINGFLLEQPLAGPGQLYRLIEHFIYISWSYDSPRKNDPA